MAFYKKNNNYGENRESNTGTPNPSGFRISNISFNKASLTMGAVAIPFTVILCSPIITKKYYIDDDDIKNISAIAAGIGSFALAIPSLLKEFDNRLNFWKQFYLIAFTFIITTLLGVLSFLELGKDSQETITVKFLFLISFTISAYAYNIPVIGSYFINGIIHKRKQALDFSLNPVFNLFLSYLCLGIALFFSEGNWLINGVILSCVYGFYLLFTLMSAVLIEIFKPNDTENKFKEAIEAIVNSNKNKTTNEQELMDELRKHFNDNPEIVSKTKIKYLVSEMDSEDQDEAPKVTILDNDSIIPRWTSEFDKILIAAKPKYIFLKYTNSINQKSELTNVLFDRTFLTSHQNNLYTILSKGSGLSAELLEENNSLVKKYEPIKSIHSNDRHRNYHHILIIDKNYLKEFIELAHPDYFNTLSKKQYEYLVKKNEEEEVYMDEELDLDLFEEGLID